MDFEIYTDTAGAKVADLADELEEYLRPRIKNKYSRIETDFLIAFRCLPEAYKRRTFTRYEKKDNRFIIDISFILEDYVKMYKIEQRYHIGNSLIECLNKVLEKQSIEGLDQEEFIADIIKWGKELPIKMEDGSVRENNWFSDEIDWTSELDM